MCMMNDRTLYHECNLIEMPCCVLDACLGRLSVCACVCVENLLEYPLMVLGFRT